ncbi:hypothetical protein T439DRAFT_194364 [Meredithblackwellia eburnea MCA 4105]
MQVGTKKEHLLDLDDYINFPHAAYSPVLPPDPGETWVFLVDILSDQSLFGRPVFEGADTAGSKLYVAWYTGDHAAAKRVGCKPGTTLAVQDGRMKVFMDGRTGLRLEDESKLESFPVPLAQLKELNAKLRSFTTRNLVKPCFHCEKEGKSKCPNCSNIYCSKVSFRISSALPFHARVVKLLRNDA